MSQKYNLPKKKDNHLAEGEVTGHFHAAHGEGVEVFGEEGGTMILDAPNGAEVTHQEHKSIKIPGSAEGYEVLRVKEYDHFAEEDRMVND